MSEKMAFDDVLFDPVVRWTLRSFLALLFARALFGKLRSPRDFSEALRGYALLPDAAVPTAAVLLLALEFILAAALLIPGWASTAAVGAAALLTVYTAAIGINLARGRRDVDCGCTALGRRQPLREWLLARNAVYISIACAATLPAAPRALHALDGLTVVLAAAALTALTAGIEGLGALTPRNEALRRRRGGVELQT